MTKLSPAAQAVLDAAGMSPFEKPDGSLNFEGAIAAALRAVAGHGEMLYDPHEGKVAVVRDDFLQAIAAELDPTTTPSGGN